MKLSELRNSLEQAKGKRGQISASLLIARTESKQAAEQAEVNELARAFVQHVAQQTQDKLKYKISELGTLAMSAVFPNPYEINVQFDSKRGRTECLINFLRDGEVYFPMDDSGGGAIDVAAFALRPTIWSMIRPKPRPLLILDEPFSGLKGEDANEKVLAIAKEISEKLPIQILMIGDERVPREVIAENCDTLFEVWNPAGTSIVERVK